MLNYLSPVSSLGFGVCGANLLEALDQIGAKPALFPIGPLEVQHEHQQECVRRSLERSRRFSYGAPSLRVWHQFAMHEHVGRGPKAGYSFFELDRLTEDEVHHQNGLDTVFASSEWAADVMRQSGVRVPIVVAKPAVDTRVFHPGVTPLPLKKPTPDTCVFLSVGKWSVLKGHDWLVRVFNAAFTVSDDVLLVLACFNPLMVPGFNGPEESRRWERLYMESSLGRAGKIRVVSGRLPTQRDVASLMAGADCGVFLARGEGFNLELAEMLAMGRHCVATNYAAHRDFAGPGGCRLVEVKETEEGFEPPFLPAGKGGWARLGDDEFEQAVAALRAVLADKQAGRLGFNQAGYELFQRQTWAGCARTIMEHLS